MRKTDWRSQSCRPRGPSSEHCVTQSDFISLPHFPTAQSCWTTQNCFLNKNNNTRELQTLKVKECQLCFRRTLVRVPAINSLENFQHYSRKMQIYLILPAVCRGKFIRNYSYGHRVIFQKEWHYSSSLVP